MLHNYLLRIKNKSLKLIVYKIAYYLFKKPLILFLSLLPLKTDSHKIVFESHPDFGDNAVCFFEYLVDNSYADKYKIIWLVDEPDKYASIKNVVFVKKSGALSHGRTVKACYHIFTAKYIMHTHTLNCRSRCNSKYQKYINLWHGCGYKAAKQSVKKIDFDYVLVPGELFVKTKQDYFGCEREKILPIGYPRYDKLLSGKNIKGLPWEAYDAVVWWMPTFRKSDDPTVSDDTNSGYFGIPLLKSEVDFENLNAYCKDNNIALVFKLHIYQNCDYRIGNYSNLFLLKNSDFEQHQWNLYELLGKSDALISDYSSVAIDYLLLDKPIGYVLTDYDAYRKKRGFVFDSPADFMPGQKIYSADNLKSFLLDVKNGKDLYKEERRCMKEIMHNPTDNYCERIAKFFNI